MTTATATRTQRSTDWERLAGLGGITFAVVVASANIALPNTPAWDASGAEVATFVHDHHALVALTAGGFALSAPALMFFVAGYVMRIFRSEATEARVPALVGAAGAVMIGAMFSVVVTMRLVLLAADGSANMTAPFTEFAWHLEGAAFVVNMIAVGIAMFGLAWAGARAGLVPAWFRPLSVVALGVSVLETGFGPAWVNGADGWQIGFVTFLSWLLFLLVAGTRMLREPTS
jgi:hypothetical protein